MRNYFQMIKWMRPSGSAALDLFCEIYLEPYFGKPDLYGNYIKVIPNKDGSAPNLCFTAHSDTVHQNGGIQDTKIEGNWLFAVNSDCLGADCTTGIWLILEMMHAKIPGVYVIHADEEVGCIGSRDLVRDNPAWLDEIDAVISFDRKGSKSVVTHQIGYRTASDAFAKSFAEAVDMPELVPDAGGVYTDSNEYAEIIGECTNIGVGYLSQHTSSECQDLAYLQHLRDKLIAADWSKLVFERDPKTSFYDPYQSKWDKFDSRFASNDYEKDSLLYLVETYSEDVAEYLYNLGFTADTIAEELGIDDSGYLSRVIHNDRKYIG